MTIESNRLRIIPTPEKISTVPCDLGEGLYVDSDCVAWVDIDRRRLFALISGNEFFHELDLTVSVILSRNGELFLVGSDVGLCELDVRSGKVSVLAKFPGGVSSDESRSNDGCVLEDGGILLGTVLRNDPLPGSGGICLFGENGVARMVEFDVAIPNSFVCRSDGSILVSDSLEGVTYSLKWDADRECFSATMWHDFSDTGAVPDGGCLLPDGTVVLAMWDGAALFRLTSNGEFLEEVEVPCGRPTNCKYDRLTKSLFVTTATDVSDSAPIPNVGAGHTYKYKLAYMDRVS